MKKDLKDFDDLLTLVKVGDQVVYHTDIDFNPGPQSIVLLCNSKDMILTNPKAFMKFLRRAVCISLTATA